MPKDIREAKFIKQVEVRDPDTLNVVTISIYKDPGSAGIFGIDESYLDQVTNEIRSPFDENITLSLP